MQLFHHYNLVQKHRELNSDFWSFELSVWLHVFGRALVAVFIPILLLQLDYTIGDVMIYYFLANLFDLPLNFFARSMTRRFGARMVITIGTVASIVFFGILFNLGSQDWLLLTALALAAAIYDAFYWVAHIYFFMESSKKRETVSKDTSLLSIVRRFGGLLAPAFGAIILIVSNKNTLIVTSIIILIVSILPLLKANGVSDKPSKKQLTFKEFFSSKVHIRDYLIMSLYGVHGAAEGIVWPVFIYLVFESIESVAIIPVIVSGTAIVFTYFAGKIHKRSRARAVALGALLVAIAWMLRIVIDIPLYYYMSVFLIGLFTVFITVPMDSNIYERGEKIDSLTASTYRNFFSMASKSLFFGVLALLTNVFNVSFVFAAGSMVLIVVLVIVVKESSMPTAISEK